MSALVSRSRAVATPAELGHELVAVGVEREESPGARRRRRERENHSLVEWRSERR